MDKVDLTHRNGMKQTICVKCLRLKRLQWDEDYAEFIAVLFPPRHAWLAAPSRAKVAGGFAQHTLLARPKPATRLHCTTVSMRM